VAVLPKRVVIAHLGPQHLGHFDREPDNRLNHLGLEGLEPHLFQLYQVLMSSLRSSFRFYQATLKWGTSSVNEYKTSAAVAFQGHGQSLVGVQGADRFPQDPVKDQNRPKPRPPVSITDTFTAVA